MDLYLITGFLGAGKTTFLRQFARCFAGRRLQLIINEFGKAGVDGALLREVNAALAEITNGSIFCACRLDQFETALRQALDAGPEVILVEASGLADPTNVQRVLAQPAFSAIRYRGSVCLVDTPRLEKVLHTARVCPRQIAVSSLVLLNKADLADDAQLCAARQAVEQRNPAAAVRETSFGRLRPEWLELIRPLDAGEAEDRPDIRLQKQLLGVSRAITADQLTRVLRMLTEETWRVKGIVQTAQGRLLVDCVGPRVHTELTDLETENDNRLVLLAGPGMQLRRAVKQAVSWYPQLIWEEKP